MAVEGLIYWGEVNAAGDITMATIVETSGTRTRQAIIDLITPIAAGIIADDPTIIAAAEAAVDAALATQLPIALAEFEPRLVREADLVVWAASDARRRDYLGIRESGTAFAPIGMDTPYAGEEIPDAHVGIIAGTYDLKRRRYYQDAIGPDGRFLQSTIDDVAARIGSGGGGAVKPAPLALTCAAGGTVVDTAAARTVRYPVQIPVASKRFRVHIANRNDRTGTLYPGAVSFTGLWWGEAAYTAGEMTGAMATAPLALQTAFSTPANGSEWISPWFDQDVPEGVNHLLSVGYTNAAGQTNHAGQGGAFVSTDPANASVLAPALSRVQQAPFDVWLEFEIPAEIPIIAALGDSLTAGTAATLPVHDSWPMPFAAIQKVWPAHFAHHGSDMSVWTTGDEWRWIKYGDIDYAAAIWALGSNDLSGGIDLPTAQARFAALHPKVVNYLSPKIFLATIMPRNNWSPAIEAVRVSYNSWLFQRPLGAEAVVDFAKSVEASVGVVRPDYISGDGTHLLTIGYAQNALAIPGRLAH